MSKNDYPPPKFPQYVNSLLYIMTREAIEQMLEVSRHVKAIDIEDVLFTGILREKGKIHLEDINIHIVSNEKVYSLLKRFLNAEKVKNIVHF